MATTTEANNTQAIDTPTTEDLQWEDAVSTNGKPYKIGRPAGAPAKPTDDDETPLGAKKSFHTEEIYWPVSDSDAWVFTPSGLRQQTGISRYRLTKSSLWGAYVLQIETDESYNYTFFDEDGDGYGISVWSTKWSHTVRYSSNKPAIHYISGN